VLLVPRAGRLAKQVPKPGPQLADGQLPHGGGVAIGIFCRHNVFLYFELWVLTTNHTEPQPALEVKREEGEKRGHFPLKNVAKKA
jgi:hypothetical protein